jgi:hypothetical protein
VDGQDIVEVRGPEVTGVRLERQRLDAVLTQRRIPAAEASEVGDAGDLEPHEVLRVVRDSLRIRLGEAHADLGPKVEAVDAGTLER